MDTPLLQINNLKINLQTATGMATAVDGVSFNINKGETFALLGESGCGKSITALSIMQLLPNVANISRDSQIILEQTNLLNFSEVAMRRIRGKRIAMIFQEPMTSLNPVLSIGQQIAEVIATHQQIVNKKKQVVELLDAVGIAAAKTRQHDYPHQLSGGMKQRVMIAMALAAQPDLLIADEPTTALDVTIQAQVLGLLREKQQQTGMAILFITHDLGIVQQMADRVAVMYAGHLIEQAHCKDFFAQQQHPYSQKLFAALPNIEKREQALEVIPGNVPSIQQETTACRFADRCEFAWQDCKTTTPSWLNTAKNHQVRCHLYDPAYQTIKHTTAEKKKPSLSNPTTLTGNTILQAQNIKIHFPIRKGLLKRIANQVKAVDGVDLNIKQGQTLALVGESGCGKTTISRGLLQLIELSNGTVQFNGVELTGLSHQQINTLRKDIQIIFQDPFSSMNPRMLVADIIMEGLLAQKLIKNRSAGLARVDELLHMVGLPSESKSRYPHEFSGGQKQRICIARALALNPKLIICDEPTSALDVSVQAQILNLLKQLQQTLGLSYLFITHNISVVAYLADEVAVMYLGRIVEHGKTNEVLNNPKHPYTQALLAAVPKIGAPQQALHVQLQGEQPSPINPPSGCHFHPRCPQAMDKCKQHYPGINQLGNEHEVKCFLYGDNKLIC